MASQPSKDVRELETACPSALEKKQLLSRQDRPQPSPPTCTIPPHNERDDPARRNMPSSLRKTIVALLVGVILLFGLVTAVRPHPCGPCPFDHACRRGEAADAAAVAAAHHHGSSGSGGDETAFSCLLNAVSPEALHDVLLRHFPGRFKHGVWPSDQSAIEAVHRDNPPLATSLVQIAKRQAGSNTTITTTTATTTPTTTLPTTTVDTTTTKDPPITTTFVTSISTDTTRPVSPTTSPANTQTTRTEPSTTTAPESSRTTTRSSRPVTSVFTSTAPNGEVNVVTLTAYVGAESSGTSKTEAEGSLQTNAAVARSRHVAAEALAGVVLGGLMLV